MGLVVRAKSEGGLAYSVSLTQRLDESGVFRQPGLAEGVADLEISSDRFAACSFEGIKLENEVVTSLEVRFAAGATLGVHVYGADGKPFTDATVSIRRPGGAKVWCGYPGRFGTVVRKSSFEADMDGNVVFERVPAGAIEILVEAGGYASVSETLALVDGTEQFVRIELRK